jgi:Tol biopolymer transport system component
VNRNRVLTGQRFDPATHALDGSAVPLAGAAGTPNTWFSVSAAGTTLAAAVRHTADDTGSPGDPPSRLRWSTRQGEFVGDVGEVNSYWSLRLAPDGRRVAANFGDPSIWLLQSGSRRVPLTTTPNGQDFFPVWSPDGRDLVFFRVTDDAGSTFRRAVGAHGAETVLNGMRGLTTDWSRDGTTLLLTTDNSAASRRDDVSVYDLATSTMSPWLATTAAEHHARFSPDGRWIVYTSDASGRSEVLVGARRGGGTPLPVSSGGGRHAVWRSDGRELFYLGPNDELMAVAVTSAGDGLQLGEPARLFRIPLNDLNETTPYDVSPDGQRFLLNVPEAPLPLLFIRGVDRLISGGGR